MKRAPRTTARLVWLLAALSCGPDPGDDPCAGADCSGRGRCTSLSLGSETFAFCACAEGYHPLRPPELACEANDPADPCLGVDCLGRGRCVLVSDSDGPVSPRRPVCECEPGTHPAGLACLPDDPADACRGVTCSGHGACELRDRRPACSCEPGFAALSLECLPDPCAHVACSGRGTCELVESASTDGAVLTAACDCPPGSLARGLACPLDPCAGVSCSGHGTCLAVDASLAEDGEPVLRAACVCEPGFVAEGELCLPDLCAGVACSGHGTCHLERALDSGGRTAVLAACVCDPGFHAQGQECLENDPGDACRGVSCSGHGDCRLEDGAPACECDPGYVPEQLQCLPVLPASWPFGINGYYSAQNTEIYGQMRAANIGWVRLTASWMDIEPNDGDLHWAQTDAMVDAYVLRGFHVYLSIGNTPAWAARDHQAFRGVPADPDEWMSFVRRVTDRYSERGVFHYGLWNEPARSHPGQGFFDGTAADYREVILKPGYAGAKSGCPDCLVFGPEHYVNWDWPDGACSLGQRGWLRRVLQDGGAAHLDGLSIHIYADVSCGHAHSVPATIFSRVDDVLGVMDEFGIRAKPLWITETGWPVRDGGCDQGDQARKYWEHLDELAGRFFVRGYPPEKIFFYTFQDDGRSPQEQYGLLEEDRTPKQAYYVYSSCARPEGCP
ncbi:MAG: beta-galactosidase [Deltaproteobacteria bacterium]|nr:beta-galactosidase [Deltaproteobacteria bacterium]